MLPACIKEEDFIYTPVSADQVLLFREQFFELLNDFALTIDMSAQIEVIESLIGYICKRVDQRKDYYLYYHSSKDNIMHMSHEKEMGLWAYWVSKYKPIRFSKKADDQMFFI